ncbi:MAG: response regulator [Verrucomicrobiales bacterium]|nr:response regulator [Verrucomicrobiales bacterium]
MDSPPNSSPKVLIVEDDVVTARNIEAILKKRGFSVSAIVNSREQALQAAAAEKPQIALIDIKLGTVNSGTEIAKILKAKHHLAIVFVTGYSEDAVFEKAREARPAAFIRKPFSEAELAACLEAVAEQGIAVEELAAKLPGIQAVSAELSDAVIVANRDGEIAYLNAAAESLTGWRCSEAIEKPQEEILPLTKTDGTESILVTREGDSTEVTERSAAIRSGDGEVVGVITILTSAKRGESLPDIAASEFAADDLEAPRSDLPPARADALKKIAAISSNPAFRELIRERKRTIPGGFTPALKEEPTGAPVPPAVESQLPSDLPLIEDVTDPLVKIDTSGKITYANSEATTLFGNGKSLVGLAFWDRFSTSEFEEYDEILHRPLTTGRKHRFEFHDTSRDLWFEVRSYRTDGGVLALFSDITSGKMEDAESIRQQRLEGLGLLARGFAHDFNNRLTAITGNISLARERQPEDIELQNLLGEAQTAAAHATGLVQQLMTFAQGGRPIRKQTRVSDLIRRILTEHRIQHPDIRYQFQGADPELIANIDPAQVSRLIENLIANSALAMSQGGVLIVRSARISPDEVKKIKGSHSPTKEDHLLIEVIDTGHGMKPEALDQVFEPYFTTRPENNASGIGLTVCESIAKAHSGFIQLQSKEGKGTIATFCAPLGKRPTGETEGELDLTTGGELPMANLELPALGPLNGTEAENFLVGTRILILEDDAPIRRLMAATLRRAGHEVVETKDGNETIAAYREAMEGEARFHLLICDLTIENGLGGVETMRQLTELDPAILAIVSSGYSDAPAMANPSAFGFRAVLPKPYAPSELRAAVHRILTAHHIIS